MYRKKDSLVRFKYYNSTGVHIFIKQTDQKIAYRCHLPTANGSFSERGPPLARDDNERVT